VTEWDGYHFEASLSGFDSGMLVLDIGCGPGEQLLILSQQGCLAVGLDLDRQSLAHCTKLGFPVIQARAEQVPIADASCDGILCKVVLPYTDEKQVIREIARLLKPGGRCQLIYHGAGYYLRYLLRPPSWKHRLYGFRALINTWVWVLVKKRLPGFLGDTIYQSARRLNRYYRKDGLRLVDSTRGKTFIGLTVFSLDLVEKV